MSCAEVRMMIPDYVDAKLLLAERSLIEEHLARCPACREEAAALRSLLAVLPRHALEHPSPAYWGSVLPRIHARIDRRRVSWLPAWRLKFAMPILSAALLVILIINSVPTELPLPAFGPGLGEVAESELLAFVEQQTAVGTAETSSLQERWTSAEDLPVLKVLLKGETHLASYIDGDQETLYDALPERDVDQLMPVLEKSYPASGQRP